MGICITYCNSQKKNVDIIVPNNEVITGKNEEKEVLSNKRSIQMKNIKNNSTNKSGPSTISTDNYIKTKTYSHNLNITHNNILIQNKIVNNCIDKKNTHKNETNNLVKRTEKEEKESQKIFAKTEIIQLKKENHNNYEKNNTNNEDKTLLKVLKAHFLFENFDEEEIKNIINSSINLTIDSEKTIFKEGEEANAFYIMKNGSVKLYDKNMFQIISKDYFCFGEIGLMNSSYKRKYSVITQSKTELFVINKKEYNNIIQNKNIIEENKENLFNFFIEKNLIFKGITNDEKNNLLNLIRYKEITQDKRKFNIKENSSNCLISNNYYKIFFVGKGKIQVSIKQINNNYITEFISEGHNFGIKYLFFNEEEIKNQKGDNITEEDFYTGYSKVSEILCLNEKIFIECFGLNYKNYLLNSCILYSIKNDYVLNTIKMNCKIQDEEMYKLFKVKKYKQSTLIYQKGISSNNKKSIILLEGKLSGLKKKDKIKNNYLLEGKNLFIFKDFEDDFITLKNSILLEITVEHIQKYLNKKNLNPAYVIILYNILNKFQIFNEINFEKAFEIIKHIHIKIYKQNHIIQKIGNDFNNIYLIENGTIGVYSDSKDLKKIIDTGNSFGELSILQEQKSLYNYIVYSKEAILYQIDKNYYMDLLSEPSINDYIKHKMYLESDISLNDLYYLSYLGRGRFGNVCLTHNEIFFYAIKAISKSFAEKQKFGVKYLFYEKNTLFSMDHPFILKLIKTLKNENWLFFLMEYISGINLGEYLETKNNKRNLFETKFYAASILLAIDYCHRKKIIHRDIKPANMMIDKKGYIKLIDFGTAKILNENEKTKTVIGSPNFISPEVLLGKGYSFSCDYWSIGICIYYIFYGVLPFGNNSVEIIDTYKEIIEKEVTFPDNNNIELNSLLNTLLDKNENNRLSIFKMIKTHFFFKDIDFDALLSYKIKPPFIPLKEQRINDDNFQNKTSPFVYFMENQKSDTKTTVTLKAGNNNKKNSNNNYHLPNNWYESF